jgi:hypothetical protein
VRSIALVVIMAVGLSACASNGVYQAEQLATPFPGVVLAATAGHGQCDGLGCPIEYRLRFTNPMARDANVMECGLVDRSLRLPLNTIAGVEIPAHATRTVGATYILPIEKEAATALVGQRIACVGLDWHGHAPI